MSRADLNRELGLQRDAKCFMVTRVSDDERWAVREWCARNRTTVSEALRQGLQLLMTTGSTTSDRNGGQKLRGGEA